MASTDSDYPPIPTYEEATSSNPEEQRLLGADLASSSSSRRRNGYHHPPSAQSVRSSEDSLPAPTSFSEDEDVLPSETDSDSEEGLRREVEQMDILDPDELEDGDSRGRSRNSKWYGRILGFKRRLGRWQKSWGFRWRTPSFPENWRRYVPSAPIAARLFGLITIITLAYIFFVMEVMPSHSQTMGANWDPEGVRMYAQGAVDVDRIRAYLQYYTSSDHLAGTVGDMTLAKSMLASFQNAHFDQAQIDEYVMCTPTSRRHC